MEAQSLGYGEGTPKRQAPGSTSSSLLQRIKLQDPEAWRRFVQIYGPLIYYWCSQAGARYEDAKDLGQEVFRKVARSISDFRRDREGDTFRGWLRTITRNAIRDHHRRDAKQPRAVMDSEHLADLPVEERGLPDEHPGSNASVCRRALESIREEFRERTWKAFWNTAVEDQRASDVAESLGMTALAVRKAKSRVLARLREELHELIDWD